MAKPQISYNYDQDSDTTTIVTVEKVNGQFVTTTKTLEGNHIPEKSLLPRSTSSKIILGLLALGLILQILESAPQIIVTPAAIFGAVKFTKNKTKLEKTIAITAAGIVSLVACSLFVQTPVTSFSSSTVSYESKDKCLLDMETNKTIVDLAIKNSNMPENQKKSYLGISDSEYKSLRKEYSRTGVCNAKSIVEQY